MASTKKAAPKKSAAKKAAPKKAAAKKSAPKKSVTNEELHQGVGQEQLPDDVVLNQEGNASSKAPQMYGGTQAEGPHPFQQ
jgi:hypothetical protein